MASKYGELMDAEVEATSEASAPASKYGSLMDAEVQSEKTALNLSLHAASEGDPDRKAKAIELSKKVNLPASFIEENIEEISKQVAFNSTDADDLIKSSPGLAKWLQDPDNSTLAKDDLENLRKVEKTVQDHGIMSQMYSGLQSGIAQVYSGVAKVPALAYDIAAIPQNALVSALGMPERQVKSPEWLRKNPVANRYDAAAEAFAAEAPLMHKSFSDEVTKGNYAEAGKAAWIQFVANAPQQAALVVTMMSGVGPAGLAFAGTTTAAQANAENQGGQIGADGKAIPISPLVGTFNAVTKGLTETAFESIGTFGIFKKWAGVLSSQYGAGVSKEVMKNVGKTIAYSVVGNANEEMLTSIANDFTDYSMGVNPDALKGIFGRGFDAGVIGALSGGTMTGPGAVATGVQQGMKIRQTQDFYKALGDSAQSSKLRERMPEAQKAFVEQIVKDGPVEYIYIPEEAVQTYFQGNSELTTKFVQDVGVLDAFNEAQSTGADIKIPLSQWVSKVVGTEYYQGLANDVKFSPEDMTANEFKALNDQTKAEAEAVEAEAQAEIAKVETEKKAASRKIVEDSAFEKFKGLGAYDDATARTYAQFFAKKYETRAEARGKGETADQLWEAANVEFNKVEPDQNKSAFQKIIDRTKQMLGIDLPETIVAQAPVGEQSFEQSQNVKMDPKARLKRAKEQGFDTSKVWYHGTKSNIEYFDRDNVRMGEAFFFTDRHSFANLYAAGESGANVIPVYLKAENTFDAKNPDHVKSLVDTLSDEDLKEEASTISKNWESIERFASDIESAGFDSYLVREGGADNLAVFSPTQIRSVNAAFVDPDSDLILYQSQTDRPFQTEIPFPEQVKVLKFNGEAASVAEAKEDFAATIQGKTVKNQMTGWDIDFSKSGKKKAALTLKNEGNRIAYVNIDKLVESAVFARTELDRKGRDAETDGIRATHVFYAPFSANGKDYIVSIKVRETNEGNKFYDKFVLEKETPRAVMPSFDEQGLGAGVTPLSDDHRDQTRAPLDSETSSNLDKSVINIDQFIADVKTLQESDPFFQGEAEDSPRGRIRFNPGIGAAIDIFAGHKDLSTILHESGHLWFNELIEDGTTEGVPEALKADLDKILKWVGSDLTSANSAREIREGITVDQHEQMARGFEAYLMEGRAPTQALRKIFAKFKVWFTSIYKNIANLNVLLDDDVRGVMDRLIAGDEAITRAEEQQNYQPLFLDPATSGMSPEKTEAYNKAIAEARTASEDIIRTKLMAEESRERKALLKAKTKEMREQVRAEAHALPIYQMISVLETGKLPGGVDLPEGVVEVKLSKESVEQVFGSEFVKENFSNKLFSQDGLPYDMVAEAFGYTDPEAMIQELANTIPLKEFIETTTQNRISEAYPDLLTDGTLPDEAVKAVHNNSRAHMLRLELEHLATNNMPVLRDAMKRVARRVPTEKQVRDQATAIIAAKSYTEMKPYVFQRAEIKAAKEAGIKLAAGDIVGAFEAKKRELLNHELFRASVEATERMEKDRQKFKRLFKKDEAIAKTRDVDMVNAGRAILAQFGLTSTDKTAAEYLAPIQAYDPDTYESVIALVQSATQNVGNWKTIKYDDFVAMSDAVQAIWDLAKSSREMQIDGIRMDREEIIQGLSARLNELTEGGAKPGSGQALSDAEKKTMGLRNLKNLVRRVEHLGNSLDKGDINGAFTKYLVRPILQSTTQYRLKKVETIEELVGIVKGLEIKDPKELIDASEIGYKFTKPELLMALLHTGNESNFKKLLIGRNWGAIDAEGNLDASRWQAFMLRAQQSGLITKSDMDTVQKIWDLNEKLKPDAQKAHKRMYGHYFNEITANPVQTAWGEYSGGYMPAIADQNLSVDADIRAGQSIEESPAQMFPTTGRGFTKARVENYTTPLSLEFSKIASHLDKVLRFTYVEPAVKDAARLVNDRVLRADLNNFDPDLANNLLIPWLKRAATQQGTTPGVSKNIDKALNSFRRTASIQFMVLNVTNAIQNFTGIFPAMTRVSPANLMGSAKRYWSDRKGTAERIMEASPYMRTRSGQNVQDLMRDIDDVIVNPSKYEDFKAASIHYGYALERLTNGFMEMVVWDAAHNEGLEQGLTAKDAISYADATVRQTQAAMNPEDIARYESSSPFVKLFSMFSGYFNTQANLLMSEGSKARELGITTAGGAKKAGMAYALIVAAPAIATALIGRAMSGAGLDEDDDGEYYDDFLDIFFMSQVSMMAAMVPGGAAIKTAINQFNGKAYDDKMNLSPAVSLVEKFLHAPVSVYKATTGRGSESKAIKEGMTALGLMTGLPLAPLAKPIAYQADVSEGKARPTGPIDYTRGLITGRSSK